MPGLLEGLDNVNRAVERWLTEPLPRETAGERAVKPARAKASSGT